MNNAEDYYNRNSLGYVDKWDLSQIGLKKPANYYRLEIINSMVEMASLNMGEKVLEIGCGTGLVLNELLKVTKPLYGTDISMEMLERAKDSLLKDRQVNIVDSFANVLDDDSVDVFLMQNDLLHLKLPKNYFDKIISMEVLRYVNDVPKALQNVKAIMKEDSIFVFTITNLLSSSLFPLKYSLRKLFDKIDKNKELLQYFVTEGRVKNDLKDAGLKVVASKKLNLLAFNPLIERLIDTDQKAKKIVDWDRLLSKIPIVNNFFDTLIFAVKVDK
ncbi:MAG: class I SAM-dependent methyltransferase [bacterium]|nr:class I SAM-dependent methyltransferase [bacterium]